MKVVESMAAVAVAAERGANPVVESPVVNTVAAGNPAASMADVVSPVAKREAARCWRRMRYSMRHAAVRGW